MLKPVILSQRRCFLASIHFHRDPIDITDYGHVEKNEWVPGDKIVRYDLGPLKCKVLGIPFPSRVALYLTTFEWKSSDWYLARTFKSKAAADRASIIRETKAMQERIALESETRHVL